MTKVERDALIMRMEPIVWKYAGKDEDKAQNLFIAVIKAVDSYDPSRGANHLTWVKWWLRSEFSHSAQRAATQSRTGLTMSMDARRDDSDDMHDQLHDGTDHEQSIVDRLTAHKIQRAVRQRMSSRDESIAMLAITSDNDMTHQEVGDRFQLSRERVRQIESKMVKHLKHAAGVA